MAQTNYTPISLYYSATATNVPTAGNLVAGELALNTADGKLFYKDSAGVVQTLASKDTNSGSFTNLSYTGTLTGGTGIVNLGSGQFYKDASGNVLVGGTSQAGTEKFSVQNSTNVMSAFIRNTRATSGDTTLGLWSTATRDTNSFIIQGLNSNQPGNGQVFNVYTNGNVQNINNSYGAISDIKLKENIVDATPKLDDLMKVKVRNYNLIGDTNKQIGVVAQELETVFPKLIDESLDKDIDGNDLNTTTKSVKYSVFVPILIKAIQEQQTIINDLKARVIALEAK
jgi:hypothetical protein